MDIVSNTKYLHFGSPRRVARYAEMDVKLNTFYTLIEPLNNFVYS
jgi:hypothetical protein